MTKESHIFEAWASERLGKPADEITIVDVAGGLSQKPGLRRPPFADSRGGRVRRRLRPWPTPERAAELIRRARHFVAETPAEPPSRPGEPAAPATGDEH